MYINTKLAEKLCIKKNYSDILHVIQSHIVIYKSYCAEFNWLTYLRKDHSCRAV